ncbi:MAG: MarR family transcriptional regulator [Proteocatella sp.]
MDNEKLLKKVIEIAALFELVKKTNFQDMYNGLSINEVHAIDFIGKSEKPKLTDISNFLNITRGGATKITKRLINQGYIEVYRLDENKKEKYFKLKISGIDTFNKHRIIHEDGIRRDSKMFSCINDEDKRVVFNFLSILGNDLIEKLNKE